MPLPPTHQWVPHSRQSLSFWSHHFAFLFFKLCAQNLPPDITLFLCYLWQRFDRSSMFNSVTWVFHYLWTNLNQVKSHFLFWLKLPLSKFTSDFCIVKFSNQSSSLLFLELCPALAQAMSLYFWNSVFRRFLDLSSFPGSPLAALSGVPRCHSWLAFSLLPSPCLNHSSLKFSILPCLSWPCTMVHSSLSYMSTGAKATLPVGIITRDNCGYVLYPRAVTGDCGTWTNS